MNKKTHYQIIVTLLLFFAITSCKQEKKAPETTDELETEITEEAEVVQSKIILEKLEGSPAYKDAALILDTSDEIVAKKSGEMDFSFNVENYELGAQTKGPNAQKLANSGKGQHIHFILNNQPYSAHYEPNFKKEIPDGIHHLVAFLSRSFHESVKNENSVVVRKLVVGEKPEDKLNLNMEAPTLIYSRPKGEYTGDGTKEVLLDFFVLNTKLSKEGNKVRAKINGTEFTITEWVPHVIKGLPMGEITIQLELVDEAGNVIPGPFNKVTRKITLKN
ncbi:hypothetical protein D1815_01750 [Aquimarina sp. AD1]|uniref:hypothetical protein n=1 Tax=Aquimarina sp. (strain AD1) TaxID=1714848 RepID=UPI000E4780A2|nr:hypothetical protein [Aquimarina sp. AD1]AXT54530.1 hypothetical protein D1815_01750 [Aquimarina sp. AD1]RKN07090.1 hypothetical protein D7035_20750 [Aquimarina sp. AD1]